MTTNDAPPLPPTPPQKKDQNFPPPRVSEDSFEPLPESSGITDLLGALLKTPKRLFTEIQSGKAKHVSLCMVLFLSVFLFGYGIVTGLFSGGEQWIWAPVKIVSMVLLSTLICLPSLYIFTCLSRIDIRLWEMLAHTMVALCLVSVLLVGFMPILFIFTMSTESLQFMGFLHLIIWLLAGAVGSKFLLRSFRYLRGGYSLYSVLWIFIFSLVVMQMSTTLRPILGSSEKVLTAEKKFFLHHWIQPDASEEEREMRSKY